MSLVLDIADYVAANSYLVVDTDLFVGEELSDSPDPCVTIVGSPGYDTESGVEIRPFQVIAKDAAYVSAEDLAKVVFDLLKNKPGFPSILENVFYCEVLSSPFPLGRDARGRYIFISNFIIRKKESEDS